MKLSKLLNAQGVIEGKIFPLSFYLVNVLPCVLLDGIIAKTADVNSQAIQYLKVEKEEQWIGQLYYQSVTCIN